MSINKENLIVYVSSRNNYDMLAGEVLKNIKLEGFEFINVDDCSEKSEIEKGKKICRDNNIIFLSNKSRGVQMATQTLVDFINLNRPNCKWIFCFQHDNYPISKNFFSNISSLIDSNKIDNFGLLGFNHLDYGSYTLLSYYKYLIGLKPLGMLGLLHLTETLPPNRWLCQRKNSRRLKNKKWALPFIIEFPVWASIGINLNGWNKFIKPTTNYQFLLWLPDVAMQFNENNQASLVLPDLYTFNHQSLKLKYGIAKDATASAKSGNVKHFGEFSNFEYWKKRWGWDYENAKQTFPVEKYRGTLLEEFYLHDIDQGPLKNIKL